MPFKHLPQDTSTLLFKLPHISNLFVFKDNFSNDQAMVRIVTEILRFGQLEMIYMGNAECRVFDYDHYLLDCSDCAIVRVNLVDSLIEELNLDSARKQFVGELENVDNAITVESVVIDDCKNASSVDIVIAPSRILKSNSRFQAA